MPFVVRLTGGAARDLEDICRYLIRNGSMDRAKLVLDRVEEELGGLSEFPLRGRYPKELADLGILDYREMLIDPYRMIYRVSGGNVDVLVIADGRRDFRTLLERRLLQG